MAMMTTIEKILAKAQALEAQAAALRLAVTILNGDLKESKRATAEKTIEHAIVLRQAQRDGVAPAGPARRGRPPGQKQKPVEAYAAKHARREKKREKLLAILKDYGKAMSAVEFAAAARKKGITSLTGISGSVRAGYIKQSGTRGNTHYSVPAKAAD